MKLLKLYCIHATTCPLGQWSSPKAHVSVPIYRGMPISEFRDAIISEVNEGAVEGSSTIAKKLTVDVDKDVYKATIEAVKRDIQWPGSKDKELFLDLEEENFEVFAYIVFSEDRYS